MFATNALQAIRTQTDSRKDPIYLPAGETHHIDRTGQTLKVVSGTAWISYGGHDYIVGSDDTLAIPQGVHPAIASALRSTGVIYRLETSH